MEPTTQHLIDLSPALLEIIQLLAAVLLAAGTWAIRKLIRRMGLSEDAEVRRYLEEALLNGIEYAKRKTITAAQDVNQIEVKNKVIADAANYVARGTPDALRHFKITDERLKEMLLARLS